MAHKTRLSPAIQGEICKHIENGMTYRDAAMLAGVSERSVREWREKGRAQASGRYREFERAVDAANAACRAKLIQIVMDHAERGTEVVEVKTEKDPEGKVLRITETQRRSPRDPKMALEMLTRRHPEEWGKQVVEHQGEVKGGGEGPRPVILAFGPNEPAPSAEEGEEGSGVS